MGHRRIEGSKHIRRKLTTKAKIAIGVAVLAVMSLGGFFFINNTDKGSVLKEKISDMSIVGESYEASEAYGEGSKPSSEVGSIIKITASSLVISSDGNPVAKGGGYVSGGGTLRTEEALTLTATAYDDYDFFDWAYYDADAKKYVSLGVKDVTVKISNGAGDGSNKPCNENTEIIARFKKKAPAFNYTYNFSISPAVGKLGNIHYNKYNDSIEYFENVNGSVFTIKSSNYISSLVEVEWKLNYSELDHNFKSEIKSHTTTSSGGAASDSLTMSKLFIVEYDIYVYKESGELYSINRDLTEIITMDIASTTNYDPTVLNGVTTILLHPESPDDSSSVWNYVIVPHTMSGGSYQAITVADPKEGGSTNGDRVSALPFSTTLSAEPADGYKFDRWTWKELIGTESAGSGFVKKYKDLESKEKSPTVAPNGTVIYTAHFIPETYNVEVDNISPEDGGTILGLGDYKAHADVPITISPSDGYKLENWTYKTSDGNTYSGSSENFTIKDLTSDVKISVKFTSTKARIDVKASPVDGGSVTVENLTNPDGKKKDYEEFVIGEEDAELVATPADTNGDGTPDYTFLYWMDSQNKKYEGSTLKLSKVASSEKFTAYFAPAKIKITTDVYPKTDALGSAVDAGSVTIEGDSVTKISSNPDVYEAVPNTTVTIKATEGKGYHFQKFIDNNGNEYPSNPLIKSDLTADTTFTAVFVEDDFTIKVVASPVTGGKVTINGIEGELKVAYGQHIKLEAKPNEGYKFLYYKDSIGNEYISNPLEFDAINGSETYTAYFVKDEVNITIDLTPEGSGTVKFNSETPVSSQKTYPASGLSNVTLTATPKNDYKFLYWKDQDGNVYPDNPLVVVNITKDLKFIAIFDGEYDTIRAIASPPSGGKITKIINDDGSITLIAKANRGYKFKYWKKPDGKTTSSKFTIPASQVKAGDVYTAYFKINPEYDARSDITKEQFYREWRKVITPNYTVTRDYMKLLAMESVAGLRQYNDATPSLKSYGAFADAQAYFDSKTGETVKRLDLIFGDSEMISAENEILTPDSLPDADNYLKIAQNFTDKKFGKKYDTEILTVKRVLEPGNFNNKKRTYLWRYTGAEYRDNIYLLYGIDDKKPKYVTPIVDEDGVLKFTIDKLEDNDVVAVVRVKIKK